MIFLPLGHERDLVRRLPLVTIAIMAVCFVVHGFVYYADRNARAAFGEALMRTAQYVEKHGLAPPAKLAEYGVRFRRQPVGKEASDEEAAAVERLLAEVEAARDAHPYRRWGYVPARPSVVTLVTSTFLHGGYMHLFFNLWFLWLAGTSLEDRWGRVGFPIFYLVGGAVAALSFAALARGDPDVPLIGASGAVAACMGAFLVLFGRTPLHMVFATIFLFRIIVKRFVAPSWVMLVLWVGFELLYALVSRGTGVAHWAHVGGFAFGAAVAGGMRLSGLDAKVDAGLDRAATVQQAPLLLRGIALTDEGRAAEALQILRPFSKQHPSMPEAHAELLRAARLVENEGIEVEAYERLIAAYLDRDDRENAASVLEEAQRKGRLARLSTTVRVRGAEALRARGSTRVALQVLDTVTREPLETEAHLQACLVEARMRITVHELERALELFDAVAMSPLATLELEREARAEAEATRARFG